MSTCQIVQSIYKAAIHGDSLSQNSNLNCRNRSGNTALMLSVYDCNISALKRLLSAGADPNVSRNKSKCITALTIAVEKNRVECVKELIRAGAFFNCERGLDALKMARDLNFLDVVVEGDENMRTLPEFEKTDDAFHTAYYEECFDLLIDLIHACVTINIHSLDFEDFANYDLFKALYNSPKANLNESIKEGHAILKTAIEDNEKQIVKNFIQCGANLETVDNYGDTLLHIACTFYPEIVQLLLEAGAKTDVYNLNKKTPLMTAICMSYTEFVMISIKALQKCNDVRQSLFPKDRVHVKLDIVKMLLANNANLEMVDEEFNTALHLACGQEGELVKLLIEAGARLDVYNSKHLTPFHLVFKKGDTQTMKLLAQAGADINCLDKRNRTPLINSVINIDEKMTELLLELGADTNIVDAEGTSALMWAVTNSTSSSWMLSQGVDKLIQHKADVNYVDPEQSTALLKAIVTENETIVSKLISAGASVNFKTKYTLKIYGDTHHMNFIPKLLKYQMKKITLDSCENNAPLHFAVENSSYPITRLLLNSGAVVNAVDEYGRTPLHIAALNKNIEIIKELCKFGADLNALDQFGNTPFFISIVYKHKVLTKYLLQCGAGVNLTCYSLCSPLFAAVLHNDTELVKLLIKHSATFNTGKNSELVCAISNHNIDMAIFLLENGADPNVKDQTETPAFNLAFDFKSCEANTYSFSGDSDEDLYDEHKTITRSRKKPIFDNNKLFKLRTLIQTFLDRGVNILSTDRDGTTCLHEASKYFGAGILDLIIAKKVDLNVRNINDATPLLKACMYGNAEAVNFLIASGADALLVDKNGDSTLHHLARLDEEMLTEFRLLINSVHLKTRVDIDQQETDTNLVESDKVNEETLAKETVVKRHELINLKNKVGETVLHVASRKGHERIVRFLIQEKCDLNATNCSGETALMLSALNKMDNIAKILINCKAQLNSRDVKGETALHIAVNNNLEETTYHLIHNGVDVNAKDKDGNTPIFFATRPRIVKFLIEGKADLNIQNENGETALHTCVARNSADVAIDMIEAGIGVNIQTNKGLTVLMYASYQLRLSMVRLLVSGGADVNIHDLEGRNALMFLCASSKSKEQVKRPNLSTEQKICDVLVSAGTNVNKADSEGLTACMYTVLQDHSDLGLVKQLASKGADLNLLDNINRSALTHVVLQRGSNTIRNINELISLRVNPCVHETYHDLVKALGYSTQEDNNVLRLSRFDLVYSKSVYIFYFFLANGIVLEHKCGGKEYCDQSEIECAISHNNLDFVRYLFATGYLFSDDMQFLRQRCKKFDAAKGYSQSYYYTSSRSAALPPEFDRAMCEPWPLVKLAFIKVSSFLGTGTRREKMLKQMKLPPRLQRTLMFQEPISRLPVEDWSKIPLCFDPVQYETLPCPRPLLYYWPVGHRLVD